MGKLSLMLADTFCHVAALASSILCYVRKSNSQAGLGRNRSFSRSSASSQGGRRFVRYLDGDGWGEGRKQYVLGYRCPEVMGCYGGWEENPHGK